MLYYVKQYAKYNINLCKAFIDINYLTKFQWLRLYINAYLYSVIHYRKAKQHVLLYEMLDEYYKDENLQR